MGPALNDPPPTRSADPDLDLVESVRAGDRDALGSLLRRHYDRVYLICRRLCGNDADAADATQEAMVAIVKGLARFDGRAKFSTWCYRVATNACIDELRRRNRRAVPAIDDDPEILDRLHKDDAPGFDQSVVDREVLNAALDELDERFRTPVVMRDLLGMDYAEIGETLDLPAGTVRSRIARGRARLLTAVESGNRIGASNVKPEQP